MYLGGQNDDMIMSCVPDLIPLPNTTWGKRRRRKQNTFLYKIVFHRKGFFIIQQSAVWENFCSSSTFVCVYPNPNSFNVICIASCSFRGLSTKITFENADRKQGLFLHCTVAASWSWQAFTLVIVVSSEQGTSQHSKVFITC